MRPVFLLLGFILGLAVAAATRALLAHQVTALPAGALASVALALFVMCAIDRALDEAGRR